MVYTSMEEKQICMEKTYSSYGPEEEISPIMCLHVCCGLLAIPFWIDVIEI